VSVAQPAGGVLGLRDVVITWGWPALHTAMALKAYLEAKRGQLDEVTERHLAAMEVECRAKGLAWVEDRMPAGGHAGMDSAGIVVESGFVGTDVVSELLGCGEEHARRLCRGTFATARKQRRAWIVERAEVLAYRAGRAAA
jgi:hypothetical protein